MRILTKRQGRTASGLQCLFCKKVARAGDRIAYTQGSWFFHLECAANAFKHEPEFADPDYLNRQFEAKRQELLNRYSIEDNDFLGGRGRPVGLIDDQILELDEVF